MFLSAEQPFACAMGPSPSPAAGYRELEAYPKNRALILSSGVLSRLNRLINGFLMPFISLISIIRADGDYSGRMINRAAQEMGTLRDSRGSAGLPDRASALPAGGTFFSRPP
jgi:hypothetical protein